MILHLDADAFFASVTQTVNPQLKNKPVITGAERGIATSISYEAKKYGIKRGMRIFEIKKLCPSCTIANSDYETYTLFSQKMFTILRSFTFQAEEYSIDEAFAYIIPAQAGIYLYANSIKSKIESSLGITVSIGISLTKSLAKLASNFQKPSGLTIVDDSSIEKFLEKIPVKDIWGVGRQTAAHLNKLGVSTALQFIQKPEEFIKHYLTKPYFEIWQELQGTKIYELNFSEKDSYQSITRSQTFHPSTGSREILWSRLMAHVESAFEKARKFNYSVGKITIYLKTQQFKFHAAEIKLISPTSYPFLIRSDLKKSFAKIYKPDSIYRTTGCTITDFKDSTSQQTMLFTDNRLEEKVKKIYPLIEKGGVDFGTTLLDQTAYPLENQTKKIKLPFIITL